MINDLKTVEFSDVLHKAGLRVTPQRLAICEYLTTTDTHPTANDVYLVLKEWFPSLSLATVYNTLDVLVGMGFIHVLGSIGDNNVHFDSRVEPHINLACIQCHKITDIASESAASLQSEINQASGYKLLGSRILYYGLCPQCQS